LGEANALWRFVVSTGRELRDQHTLHILPSTGKFQIEKFVIDWLFVRIDKGKKQQ
jgi:hypothetical protein